MAKLEELQELVQVVNRNKVKNIHVLGNPNPNSNLTILDKFYYALCQDKFENDKEYCQFLYGKLDSHKAYYKLKDRLFERSINSLFFIDNSKSSYAIANAFYECSRNLLAIQFLLTKGARKTAINLAEKIIKKSLEYTFTNISLELAKSLRLHYGSIMINKTKFDFYDNLISKLLKTYKAELKADKYYQKIQFNYIASNSLKLELLPKFKKFREKINKINKKHSSYKIMTLSYLINLFYHEIRNDWIEVSKLCNEIIDYLDANPKFSTLLLKSGAYARKVEASIFLSQFEVGEEYAIKANSWVPKNTVIWFSIQNLHFILLMHAQAYNKARDLYVRNINDKELLKFNRNIELLKIHEAFINYLLRIGKIEETPGKSTLKSFRVGKFLNEVPIFSKDKQGSNITILILQILFLLEDKKYDIIIDRAESLKSYSHRYLKEDETYRSNCFIKMLLCLPATGFDKEKVVKKAQKYVNLLLAVPLSQARQSPEVEIMPYEVLWEFILESLER